MTSSPNTTVAQLEQLAQEGDVTLKELTQDQLAQLKRPGGFDKVDEDANDDHFKIEVGSATHQALQDLRRRHGVIDTEPVQVPDEQ